MPELRVAVRLLPALHRLAVRLQAALCPHRGSRVGGFPEERANKRSCRRAPRSPGRAAGGSPSTRSPRGPFATASDSRAVLSVVRSSGPSDPVRRRVDQVTERLREPCVLP